MFNASVEAARAGEHGKGFAVVAEEVANLADMSGVASSDIGRLLEDSLKSVEDTVRDLQSRITTLVDEGGRGIQALDEIVQEAQDVSQKVREITQASEEQSRGISEISKAMNQLDQSTQQNAATSEETASSSEELSGQAVTMQDTVQDLVAVIKGAGAAERMSAGVEEVPRQSQHGKKAKKPTQKNNTLQFKGRPKRAAQPQPVHEMKQAVGAETSTQDGDEDFVNL